MTSFQFRECAAPDCRLRYPLQTGAPGGICCPRCGSETKLVASAAVDKVTAVARTSQTAPFSALLDNIRSIHNVGSMFRTADGAGLSHLYLCGFTATPEHPKLAKAALGAHEKISWSTSRNGLETAVAIKSAGAQLWALEAVPDAEPLFANQIVWPHSAVTLVVGNEKAGVDPGILALCDRIFSLPMAGFKRSLNAAVAFGIAVYHLRYEKSYMDNHEEGAEVLREG